MWLTLGTFFGYAVIYTVFLKPATPLNIVIGGASGAMPPVLGWAAVANAIPPEALILFLIIFSWTPPHFWSLALYRRNEYAKSGLPMLPITHGEAFTRLHILLYTIILVTVSHHAFHHRHERFRSIWRGRSCWMPVFSTMPSNCIALIATRWQKRHSAIPSFT